MKKHKKVVKRRRKSRYPWKEWLNGHVHEIFRGKDYEISELNMARSLRIGAEKRGDKKLEVHIDAGSLVFKTKRRHK